MLKNFLFALIAFFLFSTSAFSQEISIYAWPEYEFEAIAEKFTKETGIKVKSIPFDDMGALSDTIETRGGRGFDLVMFSIEYVSKFRRQKQLVELDKSKLPNFKNLDKNYIGLDFDPENKHSVPFAFGTTTFVINTEKVKPENFKSLADLKRPEFKNRIMLVNDPRAVLGIGLRIKGYSLNEKNDAKLAEASEEIKAFMPNIKAFDSDNSIEAMEKGEIDIAMMWNAMAYKLISSDPKFVEVDLAEGKPFWMDSLVIFNNSSNIEGAYKFLDYLMRPETVAAMEKIYTYSSANSEGIKSLPAEIRNNTTLFPSEADVKKGEFENDLGSSIRLYNKYWKTLRQIK